MDAVIFDCDGVLVDSETISQRVELECLAEIGLIYDPREYAERYLGTAGADFYGGLDRDHRAQLGLPLPHDFADKLHRRIWVELESGLAAIEGVHDVVGSLNVAKAVASGSSIAGLDKKLRKVALFDAFAPYIYSSQLVPRGKPAPDVFLHAASQLNVRPERCIAIEDSVNGVISARAAGMIVVGFTGGGHCVPGHGERLRATGVAAVVEHMSEMPAILEGMP